MTDAAGRPPAAPHAAPRVLAAVDSRALCAPGLRLLTAAMMDLERRGEDRVNAIPVRDRPVPDACHSPITQAAGLMPTHGRVVTPELINPTSLTDVINPTTIGPIFVLHYSTTHFCCLVAILVIYKGGGAFASYLHNKLGQNKQILAGRSLRAFDFRGLRRG